MPSACSLCDRVRRPHRLFAAVGTFCRAPALPLTGHISPAVLCAILVPGLRTGPTLRCSISVRRERRILCVFPAYTPSFGTFQHAFALMGRVRAFMPPQGLLLIAAYMPESWPVRFIDENIARATAADFAWADVVLVSGMHIQKPQIKDICARAHA